MLLLIIGIVNINVANAGWPITEPNSTLHGRDVKIIRVSYNMIDAFRSCHWRGICPMFPPGSQLSAFPNSEEKVQQIFKNMFRMFANESLSMKWLKWQYGANKNGNLTYYCGGCDFCGTTYFNRKPLYWYSDANQMARFRQYDKKSCNQSWYKQPGISAHHTCKWVLPQYGGGSNCDLFGGDCTFRARGLRFCVEDDCWFESEALCGGNTCVTGSSCDFIFATSNDYIGTGFVEGLNGASDIYSRSTDEIAYQLHSGAHFDERIKIVPEDYDVDGKHFVLMAAYFDVNRTHLDKCWSLYDGQYNEMNVIVSGNGDLINGFSTDSHSVMLLTRHDPPINTCEPYAFICKTQANETYRLPEDRRYYMGTEWIDWPWTDFEGNWNLKCKENHYFNNGQQWIVNGDPKLDKCDIWYYQNADYSECLGCHKIPKLDCWEDCIRSDFDAATCLACDSIVAQSYGYEQCPGFPTNTPTKSPSTNPTGVPSRSPSTMPSEAPSYDPTLPPSIDPSATPSNSPSEGPSNAPSKYPTTPSNQPTTAPSKYPSIFPTEHPSRHPSALQTNNPSISPFDISTITVTSSPISANSTDDPMEGLAVSPTTMTPSSPLIETGQEEPQKTESSEITVFLGTTVGMITFVAAPLVLLCVVLFAVLCWLRRNRKSKKVRGAVNSTLQLTMQHKALSAATPTTDEERTKQIREIERW